MLASSSLVATTGKLVLVFVGHQHGVYYAAVVVAAAVLRCVKAQLQTFLNVMSWMPCPVRVLHEEVSSLVGKSMASACCI